jgi:preprotein translocase subunit SecD
MTGALALLASAVALAGSGGVDLVLRAAHAPTPKQLARSVSILEQRAHLLGASDVRIHTRGKAEIVVHLGSVPDPAGARRFLAQRGALAFYDFEAALRGKSIDAHGLAVASRKPPKATKHTTVLRCGGGTAYCPGGLGSPGNGWVYYLVKDRPEMTGADVVRSRTRADVDPQTGQSIVLMQFTRHGARVFLRVTRAAARRGKALWVRAHRRGPVQSYFQSFAMVLDGRILSNPMVDFTQYPNGVTGTNGVELTGLPNQANATQLAVLIKSGTLPVRFTVQR